MVGYEAQASVAFYDIPAFRHFNDPEPRPGNQDMDNPPNLPNSFPPDDESSYDEPVPHELLPYQPFRHEAVLDEALLGKTLRDEF